MEKIGIIGSGTWGTAIAVLLKNNGHEVTLWSAIPAEIEEMAKTNNGIYDVLLGERAPFFWEHAKDRGK